MRKLLQFIFWLILILIAIAAIVILIEPTDVTVVRSVVIKAPKDSVAAQVIKFSNWQHWQPWRSNDTATHVSYSGNDGQAGSSLHWTGDEFRSGEAEIRNTAISDSGIDYELHMIKPMALEATGNIAIHDTGKNMIKVTWMLHKHTDRPMNALQLFLNIDKIVGGDFENGLGTLKQYAESHLPPPPEFEINEVTYPVHLFEGFRQVTSWKNILKFFNDKYPSLNKASNKAGYLTGIFYTWDTTRKETDMAAAFPVKDTTAPLKGCTFFTAGPSAAIMAVEKGGYGKSANIHAAMEKYLRNKGRNYNLVIEEYISGPQTEPDSNRWVTNVYYLLQ